MKTFVSGLSNHIFFKDTAKYIPILSALKANLLEVPSCPEFTYQLYLNSSNSWDYTNLWYCFTLSTTSLHAFFHDLLHNFHFFSFAFSKDEWLGGYPLQFYWDVVFFSNFPFISLKIPNKMRVQNLKKKRKKKYYEYMCAY